MSSYVDVNDFGAIGEPLLNHGSIGANLTQLKLDDPGQGETPLSAWKEGTGIAIAGAGRGGIHPHVTRIANNGIIDDHNFILETPAIHDVQGASLTNDDSLPIQAAIDSLGTRGGTVFIPAGTYRIGTTGRPLTFADSNQPLFISSNMRIIGAGLGATVLVLPNDVRQRQKWFPDEPQCQHLDASIFVNRANGFVHLPEARPAPDARLEVAHMTLDGNKGGQSFLFGRDNTTDPRIGDPPPSALTADLGPDVIQPPPNALVWSKGYAFAVSYMGDNPEGETLASGYYFFQIPDQDQHQGSPSVRLRLPPTPQGAKTVVVYAATDDPNPCLGNPFREYHDQHYERQPPVPVPEPDPMDTMNRPTLLIDHHAPPPEPAFFPRGVLTQFPGESSLSMALALDNAADCYLHDLELRNFVTDGLELSYVRDSLFEAIWSHDNGRHGVGSAGQASSLRFVDCRLEDNASTGCDLEGQGFQDIHFLNCSFKENGTGLSLGPAPPDANSPSMFNNVAIMNCDFDHNLQHVFTVAAPNTTPITNLRLVDCTFRYSLRVAVFVGAAGYGLVTGCDFDQNGRPPGQPPDYNWASLFRSQLAFQYPASNWRIIGNRFRPFVSVNERSVTNAAMTSGLSTLTSATAAFSPSDVNWPITVGGAGPAGVPLRTTIVGFIDSKTVTLLRAASSNVSGAQMTIGDGQKKVNDFAAIQLDGCLGMIISGNHLDVNPRAPELQLFVDVSNVRSVADGTMTEGSKILTSATAAFNASTDLGRPITVGPNRKGIGPGVAGAALRTTIVNVIDRTTVAVLDAASTSADKLAITINQTTRLTDIFSDNTVATSSAEDHVAAELDDGSDSGRLLVSATERRILVVQAEQLSVSIPLNKPMASPEYGVQVTPHWNAGGLWITDKRTNSFTIHWEKPPPKENPQQEHASGFLDYSVYL